jgi:hypothetical protein
MESLRFAGDAMCARRRSAGSSATRVAIEEVRCGTFKSAVYPVSAKGAGL